MTIRRRKYGIYDTIHRKQKLNFFDHNFSTDNSELDALIEDCTNWE